MTEKYELVGIDGNAFSIMGYVAQAMKEQHFTKTEIDEYREEATSGDYSLLLCTSIDIIEVCNERFTEEA